MNVVKVMDAKEFERLLKEEIVPAVIRMLAPEGDKNKEYAGASDRFANFRARAAVLRTTPTEILLTDRSKHTDALLRAAKAQLVNEDSWCFVRSSGGEGYKQRIVDEISYACLLYGLWEEGHGGHGHEPEPAPARQSAAQGILESPPSSGWRCRPWNEMR